MKRILFFFSLLSFLSCRSQNNNVKSSLLWEVSGNGLSKPSYLFGTMHLVCDSDIVITPPLQRAFDATQQLYLELDMDEAGTMLQSMMGMMMKNGESLDKLLPASQYDSVAQKFTSITGIPMVMMKTMKPMMTSAMLYPYLLGCAGQGWDMKFLSMAKNDSKEVSGLEDVSVQLAVFDSIPYKVQAEMLADIVLHLDSTKKSFEVMVNIYKQRDIEKLAVVTAEDKTMKGYEAVMLDNRNKSWIPVIEKSARIHPVFVAVGAAHLGGNNGVVNLLRTKGYTVKPVQF